MPLPRFFDKSYEEVILTTEHEIENSVGILEKMEMNLKILQKVVQEEVLEGGLKTERTTRFLCLVFKHSELLLAAIKDDLAILQMERSLNVGLLPEKTEKD